MKYLLNLLRKKEYLIIIAMSFLLSSPYIVSICSGYLSYYNFDLQQFLLWHYTSISGDIPYRDIFYPYGLINYFKNSNLIFSLINYSIPPILFTFTFFIFKKIFEDKAILYFSFIIFYLFILFIGGFQVFSRYGVLVIFSLLFACIFFSSKKIGRYTLILCGAILSLLFSAVSDQGFYLLISFIFIYFLSKYLGIARKHEIFREILFIALGVIIAVIPFLTFLFINGISNAYFNYFKDVGEIVSVAKTPFFSFLDSPANLFTFSILYFAIFYNFFKFFAFKRKLTLSTFLQISLIFIIFVMEQKSIIRSIDRQISFVSFILLMFVAYELINAFKNVNKKLIYIILMVTVFIIYGFKVERSINNFQHLLKNFNLLLNSKCFDNNLNFFLTNNQSYVEIINLLKKQDNFNGKIFSFPTGDSAFYTLLDQKPPYYNSIFEGASYDKQNSSIKYIKSNNIEYIALNISKMSLQDAVPDYIRQSLLFSFILNNYHPFEAIGDHIILKKDNSKDFFASQILKQAKDYETYLRNVYLYKVPYSEGLYKFNYLKNNNKLIVQGNVDSINSFLKTNKIFSNDKVVVLISDNDSEPQDLRSISFQTGDGGLTAIYYNSCNKNEPCVINLSKIPLFYKKRLIGSITPEKNYKGGIGIIDLKNSGNLW